jgi:hypothetical protein
MPTRALRRARLGQVVALTIGVLLGCTLVCAAVAARGGAPAGAADRPGEAEQAGAAPTLGAVVLRSLAPGYTVTSQGPPDMSRVASDAPDPSAAAAALATVGDSASTYVRVWHAGGGRDEAQDLLVRFPDPARARVFVQVAQDSLDSGEIVSSDPLPSISGGRRVAYVAATSRGGLGEAITMRAGVYVDLLSFFSTATGGAHLVSPANGDRLAEAQYAAMTRASGGTATTTPSAGGKKGASAGTIGLAVVAVLVVAAAVATPGLLRRRRLLQEAGAPSPPSDDARPTVSAGDAVDDFGEHRG